MAAKDRKPLKHLEIPESLGIGEGGKTLPKLYEYFQQVDDYIDELKTSTGQKGDDGVSVTGATSDGTNITFELSDGSTFDVPWPTQ